MFSTQQYFGFDPRTIPGCAVWLDAADSTTMFQDTSATNPITTDGQTIGCWKDKSGNGYLFTQGTSTNRPTYKQAILNGQSITRWNGTTNALQSSTTLPFYTSASSGGSFFFVFMITNNSTQRFLMTYQNQNSGTFCVSESEIGCATGNVDAGNFGVHQGCSKANVALNQITANTYVMMNLNLLSSGTAPANTTIVKNGTSASVIAQNGGFYSGTTYPSGNNARFLNIGYRNLVGFQPDSWFPGDIAEIVWYRTSLSTSQLQQVEGYLAWKWGLQTNLPMGHPFRPNPTTMRIFQPTDISGCSLWLDAADLSTIVRSGNNVTQINDKSPLNLAVTVSNGATANPVTIQNGGLYINNNSSSTYNASTYSMLVVQSNILTTTSFSMFVVLNNPTNVTSAIISDPRALASSGETRTQLNHGFIFEVATNGTSRMTSPTTASGTGNRILTGVSSPSRSDFYNNGTLAGSNTTSITPYSTDVGGLPTIGGYRNTESGSSDNSWFTGTIYEVIIYTSNVTDSQRQQIEGYLASKWGISGSLPTTQPYYLQRALPSTPLFTPTMISNCSLWLDAADSSTITTSGSTLTGWTDKSGTGKTININSAPTYSVTGFNNRPGLTFASGNRLSTTTTALGTSFTLIAVYIVTVNANSVPLAVGLTNSGNETGIGFNSSTAAYLMYDFGVADSGNTTVTTNNVNLLHVGVKNGSILASYVNGTNPASTPASTYNNTNTTINIGGGGFPFVGNLAEVIIYNRAITTIERQQVEGYLAWKWGLQVNVPSSHPYYKFRP
jgi:hypothetical protein